MRCTYSPEQVGLYVNGDLSIDEHSAFEHHLPRCQECRELTARLEADRTAVTAYAGAPAGTSEWIRFRRKSPRRRWLPAAAVVMLILGVAVTTQAEAVKTRLIQLFPFLAIQEMTHEELKQHNTESAQKPTIRPEEYPSIEAAEQVFGYPVGRPSKLPAGYTPVRASVAFPGKPNSAVHSYYEEPARQRPLALSQTRTTGSLTILAAEGTTREVKVLGENAAITDIPMNRGSQLRNSRCLHFQWAGQPMDLCIANIDTEKPEFTDEDMIAIAESIR